MVIVFLALLAAQDPPAPTPAPAATPAPTPVTSASGWQRECRALVDRGTIDVATGCFRAAGRSDADDAALAAALADVIGNVRLRHPDLGGSVVEQQRKPASSFDLGDFAWSGRAEVVGLGLVDGVVAGSTLAALVASTGSSSQILLTFPLLGAVAGGGAALTALLVLDEHLSPGDVHLLRAALIVANYEAVNVAILLPTLQQNGTPGIPTAAVGAAALAAMAATVGVAAGIAALVDVDPSAPSLALSFGFVGGTTAALLLAASDYSKAGFSTPQAQIAVVVTGVGVHAGLVGGLLAAPALGLTRTSILLVDVGAVVGLLGGAALAYGLNAPTPLLGYGTMATTTVVGAAAGVVGASFAPGIADQLWPLQAGPAVIVGKNGPVPGVGVLVALP